MQFVSVYKVSLSLLGEGRLDTSLASIKLFTAYKLLLFLRRGFESHIVRSNFGRSNFGTSNFGRSNFERLNFERLKFLEVKLWEVKL